MIPIRHTIKLCLITLFILIVVGGGVAYLLFKVNQSQFVLQEQIIQIQQNEAQASAFIQLRRVAEQSEADRLQLETFVLRQQNDAIAPLTLIEDVWARQMNVKVTTESIATQAGTNHNWLVIQFSLQGSPQAVRDMAALLELLPYVSEVTTLSIRDVTGGMSTAAVTVQLAVLEIST